jgi:Ca2+-binding RTX toxin-like protein
VVLALTTLGVFALPNAAFAAGPTSVVVAGNTVTATASVTQVNHITIANSGATGGGGVSIKDTGPAGAGTALTPNADCIQFSADEVRCDLGTITTLVVNAGDSDDTIFDLNNSMGSITLNGGAGDDTLSGGPVPETLNGDDGDDTLQGGAGADNLNGGPNTSLTTKGDWVTYGAATAAVQVTIDGVANDGKDIDLVTAGIQPEGDNVGTTTENVEGSGQADFLTGSTTDNILQGGGGADTLDGLAGNDTLQGEGGADDYQGGAGTADIVSYGAVASPVTTTINNLADDGTNCPGVGCEGDNIRVGVEIVVGGSGPDNLTGGSGNETLKGAGGNDFLNGDLGDDTLSGGAGTDTVSYAGRVAAVTITLDGLPGDGSAGENDNVNADIENALGGSGADSITGNGGVNRLDGGPGADTLNGGNGNDTLIGPGNDGAGDTYNGDGGTDTASFAGIGVAFPVIVTVGAGSNDGVAGDNDNVTTTIENVTGGNGNDNITGDASANRLTGNFGNDILDGDPVVTCPVGGTPPCYATSNDTLNGGAGNDTLHGRNGNDILNGGNGAGTDPVLGAYTDNDALDGGNGIDSASYSTRNVPLSLTVGNGANDGQAGETDDIQADTEAITGGSNNDTINGDNGRDTLTGGAGSDTIDGNGGNDTIQGNSGNDDLTGGGGKDILSGSTGNDTFHTVDGLKDSINCGDGTDNVAATDNVDTKTSNCFP